MQTKKTGKDKGFSLIELIIAIAILVILTGLLAPQFMKYIERARTAKCLNNMDTILAEYQIRLIDGEEGDLEPKELLQRVIKDLKAKCPSGVDYVVKVEKPAGVKNDKEDILKLTCPVHGGSDKEAETDPDIAVVKKQISEMEKFIGMSPKEIKELENWTKYTKDNNFSNDTFRKYLINEHYNGKWPGFSTDILEKNGISGNYYIQPFMKGDYKDDKNCNVIIYATTHQTTEEKNLWAPDLIYKDGQWWYKGKGSNKGKDINLAGMTQETINENMKTWKPLNTK